MIMMMMIIIIINNDHHHHLDRYDVSDRVVFRVVRAGRAGRSSGGPVDPSKRGRACRRRKPSNFNKGLN